MKEVRRKDSNREKGAEREVEEGVGVGEGEGEGKKKEEEEGEEEGEGEGEEKERGEEDRGKTQRNDKQLNILYFYLIELTFKYNTTDSEPENTALLVLVSA